MVCHESSIVISLSTLQAEMLFREFDKNGDGVLDYQGSNYQSFTEIDSDTCVFIFH